MNNNKILIQLYIPLIEEEYDIFIPINKRIGTIKQLIQKCIVEQLGENVISQNANLYSKETGQIYDAQLLIKDSDLKNGSGLILL